MRGRTLPVLCRHVARGSQAKLLVVEALPSPSFTSCVVCSVLCAHALLLIWSPQALIEDMDDVAPQQHLPPHALQGPPPLPPAADPAGDDAQHHQPPHEYEHEHQHQQQQQRPVGMGVRTSSSHRCRLSVPSTCSRSRSVGGNRQGAPHSSPPCMGSGFKACMSPASPGLAARAQLASSNVSADRSNLERRLGFDSRLPHMISCAGRYAGDGAAAADAPPHESGRQRRCSRPRRPAAAGSPGCSRGCCRQCGWRYAPTAARKQRTPRWWWEAASIAGVAFDAGAAPQHQPRRAAVLAVRNIAQIRTG